MQIIKVPGLNNLGKNNGCRNAGNVILAELKNIWSSEKGKIINKELLDLEEIHVNNSNLNEQEKLIYENSLESFKSNEKAIFLGGDHSISYSIGKAFLDFNRNQEKESCLIIFDAHADCMKPMKNPSHEEWLRALVEYGFPVENILIVGMRNNDKQEIEFLSEKKIRQVSINQLNENLQEAMDIIMEFASGKQLYVSFDIDVVDPCFVPSTGYCEVGGISSRDAIYIVQKLSLMKNLRAIDIVEIDCEGDKLKNNITVKLGAKLVGELI